MAAFDSSRVEVVSVTGSLAPERGSSVVLFLINLPNVAAGNVAAQPLEEDLDPILNEVAVNAAWGTTINNLGARVSVHRCQTLLDVGGLAGVQPGSYEDLVVTTPALALAAVQARYIPRIPHAPNPACRPG